MWLASAAVNAVTGLCYVTHVAPWDILESAFGADALLWLASAIMLVIVAAVTAPTIEPRFGAVALTLPQLLTATLDVVIYLPDQYELMVHLDALGGWSGRSSSRRHSS
ncbi:MAG: hypothetical protein ACFWTS_02185 [Pseudoclavibacter caeni]|jgi:hypothetical protein